MIEWGYYFVLLLWMIWSVSIGVAIVVRRQLDQIAPTDFHKEN